MSSIRIEIINPKAKRMSKDLADLKLIVIHENTNDFSKFFKKSRSKSKSALSQEEITKEVELVRSKRYGYNVKIDYN